MLFIASLMALVSGLIFLVSYTFVMDIKNQVSSNAWLLTAVFSALAYATMIMDPATGPILGRVISTIAFAVGFGVMIWRTLIMISYARRGQAGEGDGADDQ